METNKIYNEDCLITMARMPDNFVDCIIISPPYYKQLAYESNFNSYLQFIEWVKKWIKECFRVLTGWERICF